MSNPVITRLGVNQFWYNHWLSPSNYAGETTQDNLHHEFIKNYINYASNFNTNIFVHEYWYGKKLKKIRTYTVVRNSRYFRRQYYSNNTVGIEHSYLIRYTTQEYFPLRLWMLKYNNWLVISMQWFKPDKTKKTGKMLKPFRREASGVFSRLKRIAGVKKRYFLSYAMSSQRHADDTLTYNF